MRKILVFFIGAALLFGGTAFGDDPVAQKVEKAIKEYIVRKNPAWAGSKLKITFNLNSKIIEQLALAGNAAYMVPDLYANSKITPNLILPLQVMDGSVEKERFYIRSNVFVFQNVVAAARALKKGEVLAADDLLVKEADVLRIGGDYFTSAAPLVGQYAKGYIGEGAVLVKTMVAAVPVVAKNQKVKIIARLDGIEAEANGLALADGEEGDTIKVKRENAKEPIDAKIISAGVVEVQI